MSYAASSMLKMRIAEADIVGSETFQLKRGFDTRQTTSSFDSKLEQSTIKQFRSTFEREHLHNSLTVGRGRIGKLNNQNSKESI